MALPQWFEANRVQGHTRLGLRPTPDRPEFTQAGAGFALLGAGAFARHVKSRDEDPWWPTAVPRADDGRPLSDRDRYITDVFIARGRNVVRELIDEAHTAGMRIAVYHWHMAEKTYADLHPEWVCRDFDGDPIPGPRRRGVHLDITGPYREVVLTRLLELAEMGADGFFFDYRHLPPEGTWGSPLAEAWKARTGADPPRPEETNAVYREFIDFKARRIEETFAFWDWEVKAVYPDVVFLVSTTTLPALTDREMTTRLARIADSAKNEYRHALNTDFTKGVFEDSALAVPQDHVRQALGWTVLRDSSDGRPPHIWAAGVPNAAHARAFAGSLVTFGCVANMDVYEDSLVGSDDIPHGKTPRDALEAAFALGRAASPHLAGARPLRWAAVHFGERSRDARGADHVAAWREVLWPLVGAYGVLTQDGFPVGVVNDRQLERNELASYRLLVLPAPDDLTPAQRRTVLAFRAAGGAVIENQSAWPWSEPGGTQAAAASFRSALSPYVRTAPLRVTGGPPGRYAVAYRHDDRLVVAVTNDFSWVQIDWTPGEENPAAPAADGVQVAWRTNQGLPQTPFPPPLPPRLRAIEAITRKALEVERLTGAYRVTLPKFRYIALLVVWRERLGPPFPPRP